MMKDVKTKLKGQGGFTLIEMLLVVGIIAILVAISIPIVNANLEDARHAADQANERAAKTLALMVYTGVADPKSVSEDFASMYIPGKAIKATYDDMEEQWTGVYYDAENGVLTTTLPQKSYGQCTCGTWDPYGNHINKVIVVDVKEDGVCTCNWSYGRPAT